MKLKIVNFNKFIRSILIILFIIISASFAVSQSTFSHSETKYKTIAIINGDTLWNIALDEQKYNGYYKNKDIRYIIEDLKKLNNKTNSDLQLGEEIVIPIF